MQKRKNNMKTKDFILFFFVSRGGTTKRLVWVVLCIPVRWGCGDYRETPGVSPGAGITGVTDFKKNKKKIFFQKTLEKWFFKKIQLLAVREKYARAGIHRKKIQSVPEYYLEVHLDRIRRATSESTHFTC